MEDKTTYHCFASSPCMAHESDICVERGDEGPINIVYLLVSETPGRFEWQVRLHGLREPLGAGTGFFQSAADARAAGLRALERICKQFESYF